MPYQTGQVSVGTAVTLITNAGSGAPSIDGIRVKNTGTATVYLGGSAVTTATGFGISSTDGVVNVPDTGATVEPLFGVSTASAQVVHYVAAG
jgi:hypothetical protein